MPQKLADRSPELLDFHRDLVSLEVASKVILVFVMRVILVQAHAKIGLHLLQIQLKSLAEEMQAIIKGLEKVKQELAASENDGPVSDIFRKVSSLM